MTLQEFKDKANAIAEGYALNKHCVTIIAGIFGNHTHDQFHYSCQVYDATESKLIQGGLQPNPESALKSFSDKLKMNYTIYNKAEEKDFEI